MNGVKRLEYVDIAKAIAVFLVVLGHTNWVLIEGRSWLYVDVIYAFHMPLFFLLSGFFIKPKEAYSVAGWRRFLSKNFLALMVPYFLWGLILMPLSFANFAKLAWGNWLTLRTIEMPIVGKLTALWYLPAFFLSRVACEVVFHLAVRLKVAAFRLALVAVPLFFALGLLLPHHNDVAAGEIGNFWGLDPAFVGAAFMMSGFLLRKTADRLAAVSLGWLFTGLGVSAAVFVFGVWSVRPLVTPGVDNTMIMCASIYGPLVWFFVNAYAGSALALFLSMILERLPARRFLTFVGANTMGIFLVHKFFFHEFKANFHLQPETLLDGLAVAVPVFLASLLALLLIKRFAPLLFGSVRAKKSMGDALDVIFGDAGKVGRLEKQELLAMLRGYERNILADGKVDFEETTLLVNFLKPVAEAKGGAYREFYDQLLRARADGVIDAGESSKLAMGLKLLVTRLAEKG